MRAKRTGPGQTDAILPAQGQGRRTETPEAVTAVSGKEAIRIFLLARERLLKVNQWDLFCGPLAPKFQLTDGKGHPLDSDAQVGNYIRIDIPGRGPAEKYDWVKIEKIEYHAVSEHYELFLLQARPVPNPTQAGLIESTSGERTHLPERGADSSFIVERDGLNVSATIYGHNEIPDALVRGLLRK